MKLTNNIVHAVVGDTFVIGLHNLANDDTTVKFMAIKDKKQMCYLHHLSHSMKNHGFVVIMCWLIFLKLTNILLTLQGRVILNEIGISCIQSFIVELSIVL